MSGNYRLWWCVLIFHQATHLALKWASVGFDRIVQSTTLTIAKHSMISPFGWKPWFGCSTIKNKVHTISFTFYFWYVTSEIAIGKCSSLTILALVYNYFLPNGCAKTKKSIVLHINDLLCLQGYITVSRWPLIYGLAIPVVVYSLDVAANRYWETEYWELANWWSC